MDFGFCLVNSVNFADILRKRDQRTECYLIVNKINEIGVRNEVMENVGVLWNKIRDANGNIVRVMCLNSKLAKIYITMLMIAKVIRVNKTLRNENMIEFAIELKVL